MIRFLPALDFLSLCYGVSDLLAFVSSLFGEVLKLVGIELPDLRPACFQAFQLLGG